MPRALANDVNARHRDSMAWARALRNDARSGQIPYHHGHTWGPRVQALIDGGLLWCSHDHGTSLSHPLAAAIELGCLPAVRALLAAEANPVWQDEYTGETLWHQGEGHARSLRALDLLPTAALRTMAGLPKVDGSTALHDAVRSLNHKWVRALLDHGASPLAADAQGRPPLGALIERGLKVQRQLPKLLAALTQADPLVWSDVRAPVLHMAAGCRAIAIVAQRLSAGDDPNGMDLQGRRPIDGLLRKKAMGADADRATLVQMLAEHGAEMSGLLSDGSTALHRALELCLPHTVVALLAAGADPHERDKRGSTPLEVTTHWNVSFYHPRFHGNDALNILHALRQVNFPIDNLLPNGELPFEKGRQEPAIAAALASYQLADELTESLPGPRASRRPRL